MNAIGGSIGRKMWNPNENYIENMTEEEYKKTKEILLITFMKNC